MQMDIQRSVLSVSDLNRETRYLLESNFPLLWVEGEISNLRAPSSGHLYFTLKDSAAQVRCALFRMRSSLLRFQAKDGMQVLVHARVTLYEERGDYQLIIEHMEEAGNGKLQRAFEALKKRLFEEGLFATERKKILPKLPTCIGIITSPTGAAVRDILSVLKRRFPGIPVIIYPTQVQGSEAAKQIVKALNIANQRQECDVLIVTRGGGSLENLWPFNEEIVARAIHQSQIPVISAVGHEIDFTIADFVADHRAPTPSAAAEMISPDAAEWQEALQKMQLRLAQAMRTFIKHTEILLTNFQKRLPHPSKRLQDQAQKLDGLEQRLCLSYKHLIRHNQARVEQLYGQLLRHMPQQEIRTLLLQCNALQQRLKIAMDNQLRQSEQKLLNLIRALDGISPLKTLERGYAIVMQGNRVIVNVEQVNFGDKVTARLAQGLLECIVTNK